jgi:hypothetical protein
MLDKEISKLKKATNDKLHRVRYQKKKKRSFLNFQTTLKGHRIKEGPSEALDSPRKTLNGFEKISKFHVGDDMNESLVIDTQRLKNENKVRLSQLREREKEIEEAKRRIRRITQVRKSMDNVFSARASGVDGGKGKNRNLLQSEIYNDLYNHFTNIKGRRAYLKHKFHKSQLYEKYKLPKSKSQSKKQNNSAREQINEGSI